MESRKIIIEKSNSLKGEVKIAGAKNAVLAILASTILVEKVCILENIPNIKDVDLMCKILSRLGVKVTFVDEHTIELDPSHISSTCANFDEMRHMRASYYLIGSLLGKFGQAEVSMPGGCDFGLRPMDQHIKGFESLGAKCESVGGLTKVQCDSLKGAKVYLDIVSVGATINTMIAAVKAKGTTFIENAAKEPHVVDLANFLNSCGADIHGAGTDVIKINGVSSLHGTKYPVIPDQIEAGTYMVAALATQGNVKISNVIPKHLESISAKLSEIGASIELHSDSVIVSGNGVINECNVKTMPYPGFPTDMQPQIVSLLTRCKGTSMVSEGVWDSRFRYVSELRRMGANISVDGRLAVISGVDALIGSSVKSVDLRAGAAMIIAGLTAEGTTYIENINHIERGYEDIVGKLSKLGASIKYS